MNKRLIILFALCCLSAGCTDEAKIDKVKETVIPSCGGKTMQGLTSELLETPMWALVEKPDGEKAVTVKGTLVGDKLPAWVKDQKLMDITFTFPLDPKTDAYDPKALDGFPSLTEPEGILQAYKALVCE